MVGNILDPPKKVPHRSIPREIVDKNPFCNRRLPLIRKVCRWCPAGRPNAPTERFFVTLLGWRVCGPRVETGVVFSGVSQHAEFNSNIYFV